MKSPTSAKTTFGTKVNPPSATPIVCVMGWEDVAEPLDEAAAEEEEEDEVTAA
jgi:hypothetical protein